MSVKYQSLLGDTSIDADAVVTQELDTVVANIVDLNCTEKAVMNQVSAVSIDAGSLTTGFLKMTTGAALDTVLTCTSLNGTSAWRPPAGVTLAGDAVGAAGGNRVDTLAGGTIAASNLVTLAGTQTVSNKTITQTPLFTCPSTIQTKKIVVYDNGVASSTSDHRFSGFGIGSYTFRLHCGDSSSDFVFYGPTSATTSNEVFRIKGTGAVSAGGVMTVGGLSTPSLTLSTGATSGYILTSNASGVGSWAAPVINNLTGDITSVGLVTTASSNIVKTTATQTLTNKTLKDSTNNIDANTLRFGSTWTADLGGAAPVSSNILTYNGTNAVWAAPAAVAAGNLTGDITSVGLATTASTSMVKTTAAQTLTNKTLGYTTCNSNIYMNNQVQNKMIALFDNTTTTDQTAYNFMGFGVATSTLRYQVPGGCAHKFFVNNASSTEVLNVSGSAVSSNVPMISGSFQAPGFSAPTVLGASMTWNRSGGVAETNFITNTPYGSAGSGQGGWEWVTRTSDGVYGRQMYLDGASGNLTVPSISLGGGSTLSYYSEYNWSTTFILPFTSSTVTIFLTRVGRQVTMVLPTSYFNAGASTSALAITSNLMPVAYRPAYLAFGMHHGYANGAYSIGENIAYTTGELAIYATGSYGGAPPFTGGGTNGWLPFSMTWTV